MAVMGELRRVLRSDGVCWLNVGSSYASAANPSIPAGAAAWANKVRLDKTPPGYKPLDLIDPYAILYPRLLAQGWYVRSVIVWAKPNPMPESVGSTRWERCRVKAGKGVRATNRAQTETGKQGPGVSARAQREAYFEEGIGATEWTDCPGCPACLKTDGLVLRRGSWRPTSSYEWVLMLTKTADYFADGEAVREPHTRDWSKENTGSTGYTDWIEQAQGGQRNKVPALFNPAGRNLRDVWTFPTQPFPGAHFATFPEALVERCILASTSEAGVCSECRAPLARVIRKQPNAFNVRVRDAKAGKATAKEGYKATQQEMDAYQGGDRADGEYGTETLGWRPTCSHRDAGTVGATILDPFCGSGTTSVVARKLGRRSLGVDCSEDYLRLATQRIATVSLPLGIA